MTIKELIKVLRKLEKDNGNLDVMIYKYNTLGGGVYLVNEVKIVDHNPIQYVEISN